MGRASSWTDTETTESTWDKWEKNNTPAILRMAHPAAPFVRYAASFRRTRTIEGKDKVKTYVNRMRVVSWEPDDFFTKQRRAKKDKKPAPIPSIDPLQKFLLHLAGRDDIADDHVVFLFEGTEAKDAVSIKKGDALGLQGFDFELSMIAKQEFLGFVIPPPPKVDGAYVASVKIAQIGYGLMGKIQSVIEGSSSRYGEEVGDPRFATILYEWRYDKTAAPADKYQVQELDLDKLLKAGALTQEQWDAMCEAHKGPAPEEEAANACVPGKTGNASARELYEAMVAGAAAAEVEFPFDEMFADVLAREEEQAKEDADFDPEKIEKEVPPAKTAAPTATKAPPKSPPKAPAKAKAEPPKEAPKQEAPKAEEAKAPEAPPRKTRTAKKAPEPPPPPPPANVDPLCPNPECGLPAPETESTCPHCGLVFADVEEGHDASPAAASDTVPWQKK